MSIPKKFNDYETHYKYGIYEINDSVLILHGGGDFYESYGSRNMMPDSDAQEKARKIAEECGKHITNSEGAWYGYSEYTPDPGDVSIFYWMDN